MNKHLIKIKYNNTNPPAVFMAKSFTRKEILAIVSEICEYFADVYYDELKQHLFVILALQVVE